MSLFGKILAIMNVLLAIGVLVLANIDWGVQQGWSYAVFKRQLIIHGLPVNENEALVEEPDEPIYRELTPRVIGDFFQGNSGGSDLGGSPVKTVAEELDRVKNKVHSNVDSQQGDAAKKGALRTYLLPLARTLAEREGLAAKINGQNGVADGLADFDERIRAAKEGANKGKPAHREFRANAALLLGNLGLGNPAELPEWRKRVMTVVGMEAYVSGVNRQADALRQIADDLNVAMNTDRARFEDEFDAVKQLIARESEQLAKANQYLAELTAIHADRTTQVQLRKSERDKAQQDLAEATRETQKETAQMEAIQKDLNALQQRLGLEMQKNLDLEKDLRRLEQPKR